MATITKVYRNDSDKDLFIPALDHTIEPGEQVSITTAHQPSIVLENYEGLVDVIAEEEEAAAAAEAEGESNGTE